MAPQPSQQREIKWPMPAVMLAASAALAAKLYIALSTFGCQDMLYWHRFVYNLRQFGAFGLYHRIGYFNHPPAMAHLLGLLGWTAAATGVSFAFWLRLPAILADVGSLFLVARLLPEPRRGHRETALLLLALAPASLLIAGFHGNTDPLMIFLVVAAVSVAERESAGRAAWSGLLFGLALGVKVAALILLAPLFFWWRSWRARGSFAAAVGVTVAAASSPALWHDPVYIVQRVLGYGSTAGIWGLTDLRDQVSLALGTGPRPAAIFPAAAFFCWRLLLLAGLAGLAGWLNLRQRRPPLYLTCGLVMALFLLLTPGWGIQYLAWLVPLAPGAGWLATLVFDAASGWYLFRFYAGGADGFPWLTAAGENTALVRTAGLACWLAVGWVAWGLGRRIAASLLAQRTAPGIATAKRRQEAAPRPPEVAPRLAPAVAPRLAPAVAPRLAPEVAPGLAPAVAPRLAPAVAPRLAPGLAVSPARPWRRALLWAACAALPAMALARAARRPVAPLAVVAERFDVPFVAATSTASYLFPAGGVLPGENGPGWRSAAAPTRRRPQDLTLTFVQPTGVDGLDVEAGAETGHALREWTVQAEREAAGAPARGAAGVNREGDEGDEAGWVTLGAGPPPATGAGAARLRFPFVVVRRLRLRISGVEGAYASVRRVRVHRPAGGGDGSVVATSSAWALSSAGVLSSPLDMASFEAGRAGWMSQAPPSVLHPQTLTLYFAAPRAIDHITLYSDPLQVYALRAFVFLGLDHGRWSELPETRVVDGRAATSFRFALAPRTLDALSLRVTRASGAAAIVLGILVDPPRPGGPPPPAANPALFDPRGGRG